MHPVVAALACFALYFVVYRFYARFLGRRIFELDPARKTPAHEMRDGVDYVPCRKSILFGHHYASIAGLAPMLGPAIAVIWGWLPGMLWVVLGTLFIGAVHDFGALVVSMRNRGMSIGKVAEDLIGARAKAIFLLIILFLICLVMGVFIRTVAGLFTAVYYPESVFPTFFLIGVAMVIGWLVYKRNGNVSRLTIIGFAVMMASIWGGLEMARPDLSAQVWIYLLLAYAFAASVLPVWLLLQPRDYLNSLLLYLGLGLAYVGFFALSPSFAAPAVNAHPADAPPMFPFVFIVIACGAVSGFHGLVSSGTTSKQIDKETDAVPIAYGGMIGESLLGLMAVLACTAGAFSTPEGWSEHYASWTSANSLAGKMQAFIDGAATFVAALGIPMEVAQALIALVAVSFALTSLDSGTRLLRYNIEEIASSIGATFIERYSSSVIAVTLIGFFAFYEINGQPAGLALWALFGSTNQILGALTLLTVVVYLRQRKANYWPYLIPMAFMMVVTFVAMVINLEQYWTSGNVLLTFVAGCIFALSIWLAIEAYLRIRKDSEAGAVAAAVEGD